MDEFRLQAAARPAHAENNPGAQAQPGTSNVLATLGLRAMYFLLAGMHERCHLLTHSLALVLVLIGAKVLLMDVYKIPVSWSLGGMAAIVGLSVLLSLMIPAKRRAGRTPSRQRRMQEVNGDTAE